jgi:signal transduction histidine kinase
LLLLSAIAAQETRIDGLELGANDFLAKPFSAKELLARATSQLKLGQSRRLADIERNRLYEFFMRAPVPMVILIGPEHRFFLANAPYEKLVGRSLLGKTVLEAFSSAETDVFIPILDQVLGTGTPFVGTNLAFRLPDANGELQDCFLDVSYQPFRETSGEIKGILGIIIDATERVIARTAIEAAVSELTEERELRERFVTTLSHDLRSPLSVAHMGGMFLQDRTHDPETVKTVATRIVRNTKRVDAMICNLLDANRLRAGAPLRLLRQNCRLDELINIILNELIERHGDRFKVRNDAGRLQGEWDVSAIRRLIENLAGNAVKYGANQALVTIGLSTIGDDAEITVHNEGNPILLVDQEEIFQYFRQADQAFSGKDSGWGVGLSLVKGLAEAQGGQVRVESDLVHGTTFFVRLPIVSALQ